MKPAGGLSGPLSGLSVVVTRDEPPGGALAELLRAAGARVLHWPAVAVGPPADPRALEQALAELASFDWLVLTSAHAVEVVAERRAALPPALRLAAVGAATAAAAEERGWRVDRLPRDFHSAALVQSFAEAGDAPGRRILFPASNLAAETLPRGLAALGAEVVRVEAYRTAASGLAGEPCLAALARGEVDVVTFASPSAVDGLVEAIGEPGFTHLLAYAATAVIGPTTARALVRRGHTPDAVAVPGTLDGLAEAALFAHRRFTERKLPCRS